MERDRFKKIKKKKITKNSSRSALFVEKKEIQFVKFVSETDISKVV